MLLNAPASVLVLSDDPSFVVLVRAVADDTTGAVRGTDTSNALLDLAREPYPGVLVLDITIGSAPQRWALLDELAADPRLSHIPVVVAPAACALLAGHDHALQRPGLRVWCEPFDPDDLLAAIEALCR
jgi:CheY-like chemotaxis protein